MTENEKNQIKQEIKQEVLDEIQAESTDITKLQQATSLQNLQSLPAMQGATLVSVPLSLITQPMQNAVTLRRYKGADTQSSAMTDPMILLGTFTPASGETTADFTTRVNQAINSTFSLTAGAANEKYCGTMRLIVNSQNIELRQYVRSYANGQYVQVISGTVGLGSAGQIVFSQQNYAVYWRAIDQGVAGQWQAYASGDVPEIDEATETTAGLLSPEDKQKLNQIDPDNLLSTKDKEKLNLMGIWTFSSEGLKFLTVPDILMTGGLKVNGDITFGTGLSDNGYIRCSGNGILTIDATDISLSGQTEISGNTTINGQTEIAGAGLTVKSAANFTGNVQCTQDIQVLGNIVAENLTLSSATGGYPRLTPAGTNLGGLKITLLPNNPLQVTDTDNTPLFTLSNTAATIGKPLTVSGALTSSGATINGNLSCNGTINLGTITGAANIKGTTTTLSGTNRIVLDSATLNIGQAGGETHIKSPLHCESTLNLQDNIYIGSTGFTISTNKIEKPQNTGEFKIQADAVKILTLGTTGLNLDGLSLIADPQTNTLTILNPLTAKQLTLQLQ